MTRDVWLMCICWAIPDDPDSMRLLPLLMSRAKLGGAGASANDAAPGLTRCLFGRPRLRSLEAHRGELGAKDGPKLVLWRQR